MIRVWAPSRLHFGMLSLPGAWAATGRCFGGVGLMIEKPGLSVAVEAAASWSAEGPLAERALGFARRFAEASAAIPTERPPCRLILESSPREHVGLGTGTQLGLAVARGLALAWKLPPEDASSLAKKVGRGARSALGVHGFEHGGLLVEAGKRSEDSIAPLVARLPFPEDWPIVLVVPDSE